MLLCLPTAPNRGRTLWLRHQLLKVWQKNWRPLSVMMCFGLAPARLVTRSRNRQTSVDVGGFVNNANPVTRRENWSITTATHQQNGQHWSFEKGVLVQRPSDPGLCAGIPVAIVRYTVLRVFGALYVEEVVPEGDK